MPPSPHRVTAPKLSVSHAQSTSVTTGVSLPPPPHALTFQEGLQYCGPYIGGLLALLGALRAAHIALRGIRSAARSVSGQIATTEKIAAGQVELQREMGARSSRAAVVSSSRQRWIDGLREDVSSLIAVSYQVAHIGRDGGAYWAAKDKNGLAKALEDADEKRTFLRYRVELRLNPKEDPHDELLKAIEAMIEASRNGKAEGARKVTDLLKPILKEEWERVKREAGGTEPLSHPAFGAG